MMLASEAGDVRSNRAGTIMRKGETCIHSWCKIDTVIDKNGNKTYEDAGLYCWGHKVVKDEKGEVHIITIPLKPCDDCDDRYVEQIGC